MTDLTITPRPTEAAESSWLGGRVRSLRTPRFEDARGGLVPFTFDELPFEPRRLFVVSDVPVDTIRGRHAHLAQRQILICLSGRVEVEVRLNDQQRTIELARPESGLLIEPGVWAAQKFLRSKSVLLVLASGNYDPSDYVYGSVQHA